MPDRRGHEGLAALRLVDGTVHHPHKAWCASALRRAFRVCSRTCTLVFVLRLSAVCLSVCVQSTLLWGTAVPNLHYSGICLILQVLDYWGRCLCPEILPALYRAPALFNLHCRGSSIVPVGTPLAFRQYRPRGHLW